MKDIIVTDHQGEPYHAEIDVYRVASTNHIRARISRYSHFGKKTTKRSSPGTHIVLDSAGIAALLEELGRVL